VLYYVRFPFSSPAYFLRVKFLVVLLFYPLVLFQFCAHGCIGLRIVGTVPNRHFFFSLSFSPSVFRVLFRPFFSTESGSIKKHAPFFLAFGRLSSFRFLVSNTQWVLVWEVCMQLVSKGRQFFSLLNLYLLVCFAFWSFHEALVLDQLSVVNLPCWFVDNPILISTHLFSSQGRMKSSKHLPSRRKHYLAPDTVDVEEDDPYSPSAPVDSGTLPRSRPREYSKLAFHHSWDMHPSQSKVFKNKNKKKELVQNWHRVLLVGYTGSTGLSRV